MKAITFKIQRYKSGYIDPPRCQEYTIQIDSSASVLDGLEKIRMEQDGALMHRHSCHHSSCGTCACKINGKERLTCVTTIKELENDVVTLAPLDGFPVIGDLVVNMRPFYDDLSEEWSYLKKDAQLDQFDEQGDADAFMRFENCIECGACISACPVSREKDAFIGPAALAALKNELDKNPQNASELMALAQSSRGAPMCASAFECSRVCPTRVYPGRQIADLKRFS